MALLINTNDSAITSAGADVFGFQQLLSSLHILDLYSHNGGYSSLLCLFHLIADTGISPR